MNDLIFVATWQIAESVAEVAEKAGVSPSSASVRASNLRSQGVPLKTFPRGRKASPATLAIRAMRENMTLVSKVMG